MQDYPEVFLEELLGLPPHLQVEFRIDLIARVKPIAKPSYPLSTIRDATVFMETLGTPR